MAWAAFALYGCVVLLAAILQYCSLSRLRTHHHATWQQLGQPSFFWNNSIRNQMQWIGFSWTRRYRALGDPILNRMIVGQRILTVLVLLALLGFTVYIELGYRPVRGSVGVAPVRVVSYDFPTSPLNWTAPAW